MLAHLRDGSVYRKLEALAARLRAGVEKNLRDLGAPATYVGIGSLGCLYFETGPLRNWEEVKSADTRRFGLYFHEMLNRGIYLAPSQFEAGFLCAAHTEAEIDAIVAASREALGVAFGESR
jgi:glutamate-1-semialdehyde 2,1-aminomutase